MATFNSIFPTFLAKCGELHTLLLGVAFALFIVGIIVTVMQHSSHKSILNLLLRLLLLTSLLVFLPAWGNPLVIEKAQVDAELIRLTRLRSAHAEEQYRIRASLRHSREEMQAWTERLANLREDLTLRQDTGGDKFRIELDKQVLDNRGVAGELLLRRAEKIKTRFGEDIRIGRFAGFDLSIRAGFNNTAELILRAKNSYSTRVTDTALGTIRSLESMVQGFEERAGRLESDIKDSQKRATELEAKVGSPFEKEERYHKLVTRQSEIEEKLDLTKNQAPSQVDAAASDEREENSEKQTETKSIPQTRRTAVRV